MFETPEEIFELILGVRQRGPKYLRKSVNQRIFQPTHPVANGQESDLTKMTGLVTQMLAYDSKSDLQKSLDVMDTKFERLSLKLNRSKSKAMSFNLMDSSEYLTQSLS